MLAFIFVLFVLGISIWIGALASHLVVDEILKMKDSSSKTAVKYGVGIIVSVLIILLAIICIIIT